MELTQEFLQDVLRYESTTGIFYWKKKLNSRLTIGAVAGGVDCEGYWRIKVNKKLYAAHRLAWLFVYGSFPSTELDHINRVRDDNRIENLREVTRSENQHNKNGVKGYSWHKKAKKYEVQLCVQKKHIYGGLFETQEAAHAHYLFLKKMHMDACNQE